MSERKQPGFINPPHDVLAALKRLRTFFQHNSWMRGSYHAIDPNTGKDRYCLAGGLGKITTGDAATYRRPPIYTETVRVLNTAIRKRNTKNYPDVITFNDEVAKSKADVIRLISEAIETEKDRQARV